MAGYAGDYPALDAAGWECVEWKRAAGMEVSGKNPQAKKRQEVLYFNRAASLHSQQDVVQGKYDAQLAQPSLLDLMCHKSVI